MKTLLTILAIALLASCKSLYTGNYAKGHYFHGKAQLQRIADSLYRTDTTKKCLVVYDKGWKLICR